MNQIDLGQVVGDTGPGVASGGGIGDLLAKASSADYDTVWATMTQIGTELVKPANPVGAALSNKAAKSAQDAVEATSVPIRAVEVAAADLPAYINALPRLLTEDLLLNVSGTMTGKLSIIGFYGSGSIQINGYFSGLDYFTFDQFSVNGSVHIEQCHIPVFISGMTITQSQKGEHLLIIRRCTLLEFQALTLAGTDKTAFGGDIYAGGQVAFINSKAYNLDIVFSVASDSIVSILALPDNLSNNIHGVQVWRNGIAVLSNDTPTLLGGSTNLKTSAGCIIQNSAFV